MKRLGRGLFTLCAAASLLLCLGVCVLWGSGYEGSPSPVWRSPGPVPSLSLSFGAGRHGLQCGVVTPDGDSPTGEVRGRFGFAYLDLQAASALSGRPVWFGRYRGVEIPFWFAVPLSAVMPALWAVTRARLRRRLRRGLCAACGYDLRASRDRCPECGTVAVVKGVP